MTWSYDVTLSTAGGPVPVLDGGITFDHGWSPHGQGRFTVPLDAWEATGVDYLERAPLVVDIVASNYRAAGSLADPAPAPTLGAASWPAVQLAPFDPEVAAESINFAWQMVLEDVAIDRGAATATLEVATRDLALHETVNAGIPWMPSGMTDIGYSTQNVLLQLLRYLNLHMPARATAGTWLPADEVAPWDTGQDAYAFWDRVRVLGKLAYTLDPSTGIITLHEPINATGSVPDELLEHFEQYGTADTESASFADMLTVVWRWTVEGADGPEQREQRDPAWAYNVPGWRNARKHKTIERIGPPVRYYVNAAVNALARFRVVHTASVPLTPQLLASAIDHDIQTIAFTFGDDPSATLTILTP